MFEQSLYEQEPVAQPVQEGDLFGTYEIKSWTISPRIYKIIGMSVVVNLIAVIVFAQGSLLTMKGCDSPLVGSFCQVLDTVYIGALLFGTDREYVDADYEKTDLGDAEITYIEVAPESAKLSYPEGYFAIANPIQHQQLLDAQTNATAIEPGFLAPGIPSSNPIGIPPTTRPYRPGRSVLDTKPNPPKRNDDVIDGPLPGGFDDPGTGANTPIAKRRPGGKVVDRPGKPGEGIPGFGGANTAPTPKVDPVDETVGDAKPDKNGVYLNKRPLSDFAEKTKANSAVITPDAIYKVVVTGDLGYGKDKDGKDTKTIVLKNPKPVETVASNNVSAEMAKLTQEGILRVGDSGWLGYLHTVGVKKVKITVIQDNDNFKFTIQADQKDENTAKTAASGLNSLISIGKMTTDGDEKIFLDKASTTFDGKTFLLNFAMPKAEVLEMIKRKLAESKKDDNSAAQLDKTKLTTGK